MRLKDLLDIIRADMYVTLLFDNREVVTFDNVPFIEHRAIWNKISKYIDYKVVAMNVIDGDYITIQIEEEN